MCVYHQRVVDETKCAVCERMTVQNFFTHHQTEADTSMGPQQAFTTFFYFRRLVYFSTFGKYSLETNFGKIIRRSLTHQWAPSSSRPLPHFCNTFPSLILSHLRPNIKIQHRHFFPEGTSLNVCI